MDERVLIWKRVLEQDLSQLKIYVLKGVAVRVGWGLEEDGEESVAPFRKKKKSRTRIAL